MWQEQDEVDALLVASAREHYRREGGGRACRAHTDHAQASSSRQAAVEQGWFALLVPESADGAGLGILQAALLGRVMGESVARQPFISTAVMPTLALRGITGLGIEAMLRAIGSGETEFALAWQEEGRGLTLTPQSTMLQTSATGLRLDGTKIFVPGYRLDGQALVSARCDSGARLVCVPLDRSGITVRQRTMSDGSCVADIDFTGVRVEEQEVVARDAAALRCVAQAVAGGTIVLCAYAEGLAAGAAALTTGYLKERRQFDQPLADFQALRHRMADIALGIELAGASWRRALGDLATTEIEAALPWTLHAAKARASDVALHAAREGVQFHGAFGYTQESDIGLYLDAALRASSWLGNAAEHRAAMARTDMPALAIHG